MKREHQVVIDENGTRHTLTKCIGKGGQGEVWLTEGGRRIVKLHGGPQAPEVTRRQFLFVRRLDLRGLHVARPIAVLAPPAIGYVAEFLGDMMSIRELMGAPANEALVAWHVRTGGLRRRLRLLAHAGEALLGLHGRGVVYADVSDNNVFVSSPVEAHEAWLIDLDNLAYESDPRRTFYTPGYGAPEVVGRRAGCTTLSDAWAFAVLVWRVLTLGHPFVGDWVDEGEPELEDEAMAGELPWVGCEEDDRNHCSTGLPPDLTVGNLLFGLARRTFESGRTDRMMRPGVAEWVDALHVTADQTLTCPECAATYLVSAPACSWCDAGRAEELPLRLVRWDPERGVVRNAVDLRSVPISTFRTALTRRTTEGLGGLPGRDAHVELTLVDRGVSVRGLDGRPAWVGRLDPESGAAVDVHDATARARIVPRRGWVVFFDDPTKPQRVGLLGGAA